MTVTSARIARQKLMAAAAATLVTFGIVLYWLNTSSAVCLSRARQEIASIFETASFSARKKHAEECLRLAGSITSIDGQIGATAALFAACVAPVAEPQSTGPALPDPAIVETLPTEDLLLAARLLFSTQRFRSADQLIGLLLSRHDEEREAVLRLAATIRFDIGRDDDVLRHCDELLSLVPGDSQTYVVKAMVYRNRGEWEHFVDSMEAAGIRTLSPELTLQLAEGYVQLGRTADARRLFDMIQAARPELVEQAPVIYARLLTQEGRNSDAEKVLNRYLLAAPEDSEALILLGKLKLATGQPEEAVQVLTRAVTSSPSEELAHYQLGLALMQTGKDESAREHMAEHRRILDAKVQIHELERLAANQPQNVSVRRLLSQSYAELGNFELAEFWIRAADAASRQ